MGQGMLAPEIQARAILLLGDDRYKRIAEGNAASSDIVFWSQDWISLEQERVFQRSWMFAGTETEIPNAGNVKPVEVGGLSILILRDSKHNIRAFYNKCRHRGAKLQEGESCTELLVCPFHGWKYSLDGRIVSGVGSTEDSNLTPLQVAFRYGCIFVNCGSEVQSKEEEFLSTLKVVGIKPSTAVKWIGNTDFRAEANWKLLHIYFNKYNALAEHYPDCHQDKFGKYFTSYQYIPIVDANDDAYQLSILVLRPVTGESTELTLHEFRTGGDDCCLNNGSNDLATDYQSKNHEVEETILHIENMQKRLRTVQTGSEVLENQFDPAVAAFMQRLLSNIVED